MREIYQYLDQAKLGSAARAFCEILWERTLGRAEAEGSSRQEDAWCAFDLAEWSRALGWKKWQRSNLRRIRDALVASRIICFEPDPIPGKGRIGWNSNTEEWQCYDRRRRRAPQKQAGLVISEITNPTRLEEEITNLGWSEPAKTTNLGSFGALQTTNLGSLEPAQAVTAGSSAEEATRTAVSIGETSQPHALAVALEQLAQWRADVAEQRREVARVQGEYEQATEALERHPIGVGKWGELRRQQRFLAGYLAEQEAQLRRYEQFVALIEQGKTKEQALEAVFSSRTPDPLGEAGAQVSDAAPLPSDLHLAAPLVESPTLAPRLEGQALRQALFTALGRLFTNGDLRQIALERGAFNKAIQRFMLLEIQPEDLPVLKAVYERMWPDATCTVPALAKHLALLVNTARDEGYAIGNEYSEATNTDLAPSNEAPTRKKRRANGSCTQSSKQQ